MINLLTIPKNFLDPTLLNSNFRQDRFKASIEGKNPTLLLRMKSGFLYMMDKQFLPGYCILSAYPKVNELSDLDMKERQQFTMDMNIVGEAVSNVVDQYLRMNYSILGNTDNYLHAHIYPRYKWEEDKYKKMPVWLYESEKYWRNSKYDLGKQHLELGIKIALEVIRLCNKYYKINYQEK